MAKFSQGDNPLFKKSLFAHNIILINQLYLTPSNHPQIVLLNRMRKGYCTLLLFLGATIAFYSCKELNLQEQDDGLTIILPLHEKAGKAENSHGKTGSEEKTENSHCFNTVTQRVINTSVLPGVEYEQVDLMGYEKLCLPTGDHLLIINWGCEFYHLTFRFETSRFGTDTSNVKQWYSILTQLLYVIEPAIDSPVKIQLGINEIQSYLSQDSTPVVFDVPLTLRRDSVLSDMVFEQVKILGDTAMRLDATFTISEN
jgi:hypothetical protein